MNKPVKDLSNLKFGRLLVQQEAPASYSGGQRRRQWDCLCECGKNVTVAQYHLTAARTSSCGCLRGGDHSVTHGLARKGQRHPLYETWSSMRKRCLNPNDRAYKWYGGRGITIDEDWNDFARFAADMGDKPEGCSLERKDVNGPYSKDNCVWLPSSRQASNKATTLWVTYNGETLCLKDWTDRLGLKYLTVYKRIKHRGWSFEQAISTPTGTKRKC